MSDRPIERVLARLAELSGRQPRRCGAGWMAVCCGHKGGREETESLSVAEAEDGKVLLNCHAEGCSYALIVAGLGMDEAELFPPREGPSGREKRASLSDPRVTLAAFAEFLRLPVRFLEEEGLENQAGGVSLSFRDEAGRHLFRKIRGHLTEKKLKYRYERGLAPGTVCPYGLWDLPQAREAGYLFLVEGETDRLTLKHHGIHALGMPGAATADKLEAAHLRGIRTLHVVQEPGAAGELFVSKVAERLAAIGWGGDAFVLRMSREQKDPSAMHKADPRSFKARFREFYQRSMRLDAPKIEDMFVSFAEVEEKPLDFLWHPYLLKGVNIVMGAPGEGKGQCTIALAAAVTTGDPFPGATERRPPGNVLVFCPEDDTASILVKRFRLAGGDKSRIWGFKFKEHSFTFDEDDQMRLEAAMDRYEPTLCLFDPVAYFTGDGTDLRKANEVNRTLRPLAEIFDRRGTTAILVAHTKKGAVSRAVDALFGDRQMSAIPRSVNAIYRDPRHRPTKNLSRGLWAHVKHNNSAEGETIEFEIVNGEDNFSRFQWLGVAPYSGQDLMEGGKIHGANGNGHHHGNGAGGGDGAAATEEAVEFLRRLFLSTAQEQPSLNAGDVQRLAREAGVTRVALDRARARLGIENRWDGAGSTSRILLWYPVGGVRALRGEEERENEADEKDNANNQPGDGSEVPF